MFKKGYYYLHTNGQIIWKPFIIIENEPEYFNSPYIVNYWKVKNISDYNRMVNEAKEQGA